MRCRTSCQYQYPRCRSIRPPPHTLKSRMRRRRAAVDILTTFWISFHELKYQRRARTCRSRGVADVVQCRSGVRACRGSLCSLPACRSSGTCIRYRGVVKTTYRLQGPEAIKNRQNLFVKEEVGDGMRRGSCFWCRLVIVDLICMSATPSSRGGQG